MAIISLVNRKGGVGKSTISINLAAGLAIHESRKKNSKPVLLIDMDDQLSATITAMGGGFSEDFVPVITSDNNYPQALENGYGASESLIVDSLIPRKRGQKVKLFRTNKARMESLEASLKLRDEADFQLTYFLEPIQEDYSYIIIDNPPSAGMLPMNSLVASSHVLIPIEPDGLSLIGLADILRMVENVKRTTNPDLEVLGIVPSRFRMVRRQSQDVIAELERIYGHLLLPYIKDLADISAATTAGYDVFSYCPEKSQAYRCVSNLVDAVLGKLGAA
ncbi:MAG: ParA family protein [Anaerolineaceae bacterium]|jgi:chromosome partitioning protein|nr:ParA family protein [Anaerolineaceae bacterium]MDD4042451.1 ParA family protein [Anaerolineaceae bacterium]MDD4577158.1 ParA family protein [Anaerolineaceae bacterium]